jgi:hypothetical protein
VKRNWKLDNSTPVGMHVFWHGDYKRLSAPWVHRCFDFHPWSKVTQNRCPAMYQGRNNGRGYIDLCVIQKLDNLEYLEWKLEQKEK